MVWLTLVFAVLLPAVPGLIDRFVSRRPSEVAWGHLSLLRAALDDTKRQPQRSRSRRLIRVLALLLVSGTLLADMRTSEDRQVLAKFNHVVLLDDSASLLDFDRRRTPARLRRALTDVAVDDRTVVLGAASRRRWSPSENRTFDWRPVAAVADWPAAIARAEDLLKDVPEPMLTVLTDGQDNGWETTETAAIESRLNVRLIPRGTYRPLDVDWQWGTDEDDPPLQLRISDPQSDLSQLQITIGNRTARADAKVSGDAAIVTVSRETLAAAANSQGETRITLGEPGKACWYHVSQLETPATIAVTETLPAVLEAVLLTAFPDAVFVPLNGTSPVVEADIYLASELAKVGLHKASVHERVWFGAVLIDDSREMQVAREPSTKRLPLRRFGRGGVLDDLASLDKTTGDAASPEGIATAIATMKESVRALKLGEQTGNHRERLAPGFHEAERPDGRIGLIAVNGSLREAVPDTLAVEGIQERLVAMGVSAVGLDARMRIDLEGTTVFPGAADLLLDIAVMLILIDGIRAALRDIRSAWLTVSIGLQIAASGILLMPSLQSSREPGLTFVSTSDSKIVGYVDKLAGQLRSEGVPSRQLFAWELSRERDTDSQPIVPIGDCLPESFASRGRSVRKIVKPTAERSAVTLRLQRVPNRNVDDHLQLVAVGDPGPFVWSERSGGEAWRPLPPQHERTRSFDVSDEDSKRTVHVRSTSTGATAKIDLRKPEPLKVRLLGRTPRSETIALKRLLQARDGIELSADLSFANEWDRASLDWRERGGVLLIDRDVRLSKDEFDELLSAISDRVLTVAVLAVDSDSAAGTVAAWISSLGGSERERPAEVRPKDFGRGMVSFDPTLLGLDPVPSPSWIASPPPGWETPPLAERTVPEDPGGQRPIVVQRNVFGAPVFFVLTDETYRWRGRSTEGYARFWSKIVQLLSDELAENRLSIQVLPATRTTQHAIVIGMPTNRRLSARRLFTDGSHLAVKIEREDSIDVLRWDRRTDEPSLLQVIDRRDRVVAEQPISALRSARQPPASLPAEDAKSLAAWVRRVSPTDRIWGLDRMTMLWMAIIALIGSWGIRRRWTE